MVGLGLNDLSSSKNKKKGKLDPTTGGSPVIENKLAVVELQLYWMP